MLPKCLFFNGFILSFVQNLIPFYKYIQNLVPFYIPLLVRVRGMSCTSDKITIVQNKDQAKMSEFCSAL